MTLDLIIPHYNEPYKTVRPMLQILENQMKIRPGDVRVLFVNDGEENRLPELETYNPGFPFIEYSIPHAGVSAARNYGLEQSDADWVMFCDCDDSFTSIYSIYELVSVLDTENHDMLWVSYYFDMPSTHDRYLVDKFDLTFVHGKLFRRSFLNDNHIRFNTNLRYTEDTCFLHVIEMYVNPERIGMISPNMPLYVYKHRTESVSNNPKNLWKNTVGLFDGQCYLAEENLKHGRIELYKKYVMRAITDAYIALCRDDISQDRSEYDRKAWEFYKNRKDCLSGFDTELLERSVLRSAKEFSLKEEEYTKYPPFTSWLDAWTRVHEQKESKSEE